MSKNNYSHRNFPGRRHSLPKRGLLLCLCAALVLTAVRREGSGCENGLVREAKEAWVTGLQKNVLYSQSAVMGLLMDSKASFLWTKGTLKVESGLPLFPRDNQLSLSDFLLQGFLGENLQAAQEGEGDRSAQNEESTFIPATEKSREFQWSDYEQLDALVKEFYTVDSTTSVDEELLNIEQLMGNQITLDRETEGYQILIYHTHSQEAFADSRQGEEEDTIMGAGDILASLLEGYGYRVLHHKGQYDVEKRDYAYSEALPEIEKILEENSNIQVVIDLHRDAVADDVRLVTQVEGQTAAKVMFFNGLGRTSKEGEISYLPNPYLQTNLSFSFQMKALCDEYYPGFARSIYLRAYRYNMHLCPQTLLIELGAQTNTVEEIHNALYPLAHVLDMVLSGSE
jgi:stage II sporulation protein P